MPDPSNQLTVVTCNLRYGTADDGDDSWPLRAPRTIAALRSLDPDIMGTQEGLPFQLEELDAALPSLGRVGLGRYHGVAVDRPHEAYSGEHCALFYRRPRFVVTATRTRWLSETPDHPGSHGWGAHLARVVTRADLLEAASGRRVTVINTHFHWGAEITAGSAALIADELRSAEPDALVILTGDFNLPPESREHSTFTSLELPGGRRLVDAWERACELGSATIASGEAGEAVAGGGSDAGTSHGFSGAPQRRIDWILVSDDASVAGATIDRRTWGGRYPSDHFPVVARLLLPR